MSFSIPDLSMISGTCQVADHIIQCHRLLARLNLNLYQTRGAHFIQVVSQNLGSDNGSVLLGAFGDRVWVPFFCTELRLLWSHHWKRCHFRGLFVVLSAQQCPRSRLKVLTLSSVSQQLSIQKKQTSVFCILVVWKGLTTEAA